MYSDLKSAEATESQGTLTLCLVVFVCIICIQFLLRIIQDVTNPPCYDVVKLLLGSRIAPWISYRTKMNLLWMCSWWYLLYHFELIVPFNSLLQCNGFRFFETAKSMHNISINPLHNIILSLFVRLSTFLI